VAGTDGLADLAAIAGAAPAHLSAGGWLLLEHGAGQATAVRDLLAQAGFVDVTSHTDLAGHPRVTLGHLPCAN
jgi:release factor glutamine methyltransferase